MVHLLSKIWFLHNLFYHYIYFPYFVVKYSLLNDSNTHLIQSDLNTKLRYTNVYVHRINEPIIGFWKKNNRFDQISLVCTARFIVEIHFRRFFFISASILKGLWVYVIFKMLNRWWLQIYIYIYSWFHTILLIFVSQYWVGFFLISF